MILLGICVLAAIAALLILHHRTPTGWTAVTDGKSYGAKVDPVTGNFAFPRGDPLEVAKLPLGERPGIHYETKPCDGLKGNRLRLRYRIDGGPFYPSSDPTQVSVGPTLYFECKQNDFRTDGQRWWATSNAPSPIVAGEFAIEVPLTPEAWTSVETITGKNNPGAFYAALADIARIGVTFGGGTGYGHGVFGDGLFTLLELSAV